MKREDFYNEYAKNLEGEYKEAYKKIDGMLLFMSGELNPLGSNMSDVVDLLLVAQKEGKPVRNVLGDDMYIFCSGIIKGTKFSLIEWFIQFLIRAKLIMAGLLFMSVMDVVFPTEGQNISAMAIGACVSIVCIPLDGLLSYLSFHLGKCVGNKGKLFFYIKVGLQFLILLMFVLLLPESSMFMHMSDLIPLQMDIIAFSILLCFTIWIQKRREKETSAEENIKFSELVFHDEFDEDLFRDVQKVYAKYLERCNKKGKIAMDIVAWDEKKLKEMAIGDKWGCMFYGSIVVLFLLAAIFGMGFESIWDFIVFQCIVIIPQVALWILLKRFQRKVYSCRLEVHKKIVEASIKE